MTVIELYNVVILLNFGTEGFLSGETAGVGVAVGVTVSVGVTVGVGVATGVGVAVGVGVSMIVVVSYKFCSFVTLIIAPLSDCTL